MQFQPDSVGKFETNLQIFSNDPDTSIYLVPLKGQGRELIEPNITFNPDYLNFSQLFYKTFLLCFPVFLIVQLLILI